MVPGSSPGRLTILLGYYPPPCSTFTTNYIPARTSYVRRKIMRNILLVASIAGLLTIPSALANDRNARRNEWERDRREASREFDKERREAIREANRDRREAVRERDRDRREFERERDKERREYLREQRKADKEWSKAIRRERV
jgi:hypothetical protein